MSTIRRDDGFTLIEMLVVCVISLVVFGATMTAFAVFYGQNRSAESQSDNLDEARVALDREARQLRNLANPVYNATGTIYLAGAFDFVFQTSDPAKTWVRYCLDASTPTAGKLLMYESATSTLPSGMTGPCVTSATPRPTVVTQHVTNNARGLSRKLFTYRCLPSAPAGCPVAAADYAKIATVTTHLWIDGNPRDRVKETDVASGVYLRNQNEAPTALVGTPSKLGAHKVSLNGMGSSDPEGRTLDFYWFEDVAPTPADFADCTKKPATSIWEGPLLIQDFPAAQIGSTHTFWLVVRDPGCLISMSEPMAVTVPS